MKFVFFYECHEMVFLVLGLRLCNQPGLPPIRGEIFSGLSCVSLSVTGEDLIFQEASFTRGNITSASRGGNPKSRKMLPLGSVAFHRTPAFTYRLIPL